MRVKEYFREETGTQEVFNELWDVLCDSENGSWENEMALYEIYGLGREILPLVQGKLTEEVPSRVLYYGSQLFSALAEEEDRDLVLDTVSNPKVCMSGNYGFQVILRTLNRLNYELREHNQGEERLQKSFDVLSNVFSNFEGGQDGEEVLCAIGITGNSKFVECSRRFGGPHYWREEAASLYRDHKNAGKYYVGRGVIDEPLQFYYEDLAQPDLTEEETEEGARNAINLINNIPNLEETAKESALLYAFNTFRSHPHMDFDDLVRLTERIYRMSRLETEYKNSVLPSVGIEIEIPTFTLNGLHNKLINSFGISHYDEDSDLYEINKSFSYCPSTQSRIIEELIKLNGLPIREEGVPEKIMVSVHLNFGIPLEIERSIGSRFKDQVDLLVDAITFAFLTPRRLQKRKTSNKSWGIEGDDVAENNKTGSCRLEIKIPEFKNNTSFRMIDEAQALAGALFAFAKESTWHKLSIEEARLAKLWKMFSLEIKNLEERYGLPSAVYNKDRSKAAEFAEDPELRAEMRNLMDIYAMEIRNVVFGRVE